MISVWKTRWILWKKQLISLNFWLLFPIVATLGFLSLAEMLQEESKIPIGIAIEEDTELTRNLYQEITQSPLIRVVDVSSKEANQLVEAQQVDSAFVMKEGFEEDIKNGKRNWVITSYTSDLSFAYVPVKEMVISHVQKAAGKSKAAHTVQELGEEHDQSWSWDEIVQTTNDIELRESLLFTDFSFQTNKLETGNQENASLWNVWALWATLSILSTFFLFDWVIKERKSLLMVRLPFMRVSMRNYLLLSFIQYGILLYSFDLLTVWIFHLFLDEPISLSMLYHLFMYRFTVAIGAFLLALLFSQTYVYYSVSIIITLFLAISSGGILPIDGVNLLNTMGNLHPYYSFLEQDAFHIWFYALLLCFIIWWLKGGNATDARSSRSK